VPYCGGIIQTPNLLTGDIVNGRLSAAERVIQDLSVETLSLSRTEALCGYPFDFTTPGTEEQDERLLYEHRDSLTDVARANAIPLDKLPDADKHRAIVEDLRRHSAPYYDLQQIVRLLVLFREWRQIEEALIKYVANHVSSFFSTSLLIPFGASPSPSLAFTAYYHH